MPITRRGSLLTSAALVAGVWGARHARAQDAISGVHKDAIDKVLRQAVERGD